MEPTQAKHHAGPPYVTSLIMETWVSEEVGAAASQ